MAHAMSAMRQAVRQRGHFAARLATSSPKRVTEPACGTRFAMRRWARVVFTTPIWFVRFRGPSELRGGEVPPLPERAPLARGCSAATADRHYYMREAASAAGERAKKAYEDGELLLDEG